MSTLPATAAMALPAMDTTSIDPAAAGWAIDDLVVRLRVHGAELATSCGPLANSPRTPMSLVFMFRVG